MRRPNISRIERRKFLKSGVLSAGVFAAGMSQPHTLKAAAAGDSTSFPAKEAQFWEKLTDKKIRCKLCPWECEVADKERGFCGVRENRGGTYYTLVWGRVCALHADPIEKKPLFHFLPGTKALSIATAGCNMECKFCQNWELSQFRPEQLDAQYISAARLAAIARSRSIPTIAYTYNEPVIFHEYMTDCAVEGNKRNIKSVMISNGYIQEEPLKKLCEVLAAVKIDLKAFTDSFYKKYTKGTLKPVRDALKLLVRKKKWLEIVVLLIPTLNDSPEELKEMCAFIAEELGPDVPLHFSRFHPTYKLRNLPPTPPETLERAHDIAKEKGLHYVYLGNVPGHKAENTYCPGCGKKIIARYGYYIIDNKITNGRCSFCNREIPGVWQ